MAARQPIPASRDQEILFFDLAEIERMDNVVQRVCEARKHPHNPVLLPGDMDAWDSAQACPWADRTVMYDEEERLFKCWYTGGDISPVAKWWCGYAVSHDGVVWRKPDLGLYEFEGSRHNNIINNVPWGSILKDGSEKDPQRRYKFKTVGQMAYSADGLRWSKYRTQPARLQERAADLVAFLRDDQDPNPARRYKIVYQYYGEANKPGPEKVRFKGMAFSRDGESWRGSNHNPILSPNDGFEQENHFLMYVPYKGQYLLLYECGWYHPDGTGKFGRYAADIRLAHSRDGERFTRVKPHEVVIPRGGAGDWDGQFLVISDKIVIKDDTLYLYYCGQGTDWTSWPTSNAAPGNRFRDPATGKEQTGCTARTCMGLATLRLDGFTCLQSADGHSHGCVTSRPFRLGRGQARPRQLTVNLAGPQAGRSWLAAELLAAGTGAPLPGYALADALPVLQDSTCAPLVWKDRRLADVGPAPFRLRLHLYGAARLHSFRFA